MYLCCLLYSITVTAASVDLTSPDQSLEMNSQSDAF